MIQKEKEYTDNGPQITLRHKTCMACRLWQHKHTYMMGIFATKIPNLTLWIYTIMGGQNLVIILENKVFQTSKNVNNKKCFTFFLIINENNFKADSSFFTI